MGFFLGKRFKDGWHVGYGNNGMHVGKSTPGGWYFGWFGGGKRAKGAPMTARERAVLAGFILLVAGLLWWGLSAWEAQIKADQQAQAQEELAASVIAQWEEIDPLHSHSDMEVALTPREDGRMDAAITFTLIPGTGHAGYLDYALSVLETIDPDTLAQLGTVTLEARERAPGVESEARWTLEAGEAAGFGAK